MSSPARTFILILVSTLLFAVGGHAAGGGSSEEPAYTTEDGKVLQYSHMPLPLSEYGDADQEGIIGKLSARAKRDPFNVAATIIFLCAIIHTFLASFFNRLAHKEEEEHHRLIKKQGRTAEAKPHDDAIDDVSFKSQMFHFLGEVEAIFGIWAIALAAAAIKFYGWADFRVYVAKDVNFTEPMFVVVIMAIASSRPIIRFAEQALSGVAKLGGGSAAAWWWSILTLAPLLGSFVTEPAAMTIAALLLAKKFYEFQPKPKFAYATLGLLFVNISVGGTLTHFAAPPVLMVANKWEWTTPFMMANYGWKAALGIVVANTIYYCLFRKELAGMPNPDKHLQQDATMPIYWQEREDPVPAWVTLTHVAFLTWTVFNSHYPAMFVGGFLFFLAFMQATEHHQNKISLRSPLLVGFFLAGLVIHGGCQRWWIEPILTGITDAWTLMFGSTFLTAFNDNAAITFLASQAPGLSDSVKYAVVAGAVAGGGLTVIANAPNPAGQSILAKFFPDGISPGKLFLGAAIPTAIMIFALMLLGR